MIGRASATSWSGYLDLDHGHLFDELGCIKDGAESAAVSERWLEDNADR